MKTTALFATLATLAGYTAAAPAATPPWLSSNYVTDFLLGLDKGIAEQVVSDLGKPWFTFGDRRKLGDESLGPWKALAPLAQ